MLMTTANITASAAAVRARRRGRARRRARSADSAGRMSQDRRSPIGHPAWRWPRSRRPLPRRRRRYSMPMCGLRGRGFAEIGDGLLDVAEVALQAAKFRRQFVARVHRRGSDLVLGAGKFLADAFRRGRHAVDCALMCRFHDQIPFAIINLLGRYMPWRPDARVALNQPPKPAVPSSRTLSPPGDSSHIPSDDEPPEKAERPGAPPHGRRAARPEAPPTPDALADLLNPAINKGTAGMGSGTGLSSFTSPQGGEVDRAKRDRVRGSQPIEPPSPGAARRPLPEGERLKKDDSGLSRRRTIPSTAAPISRPRTGPASPPARPTVSARRRKATTRAPR